MKQRREDQCQATSRVRRARKLSEWHLRTGFNFSHRSHGTDLEALSTPHLVAQLLYQNHFKTVSYRAGEFQTGKLGCSGSSTAKSAASDRNMQARDDENDNNSSAMTAPKINFPAENSPQRANSAGSFNIRAKVVPLKPGRSLMDWIRLGKSGQDLAGTGGITKTVTVEELSKHNAEHDAWISIRGC